ncbi:unnamed protein product [Trifolium pratense]|uniref:Uncharacterized protein n=1 Tax=Trifolium pratense TaxID=57577 RepID=A0ACB0LCZ5_TRIPR|nr:unnamed protein product [Trifolium pratense]
MVSCLLGGPKWLHKQRPRTDESYLGGSANRYGPRGQTDLGRRYASTQSSLDINSYYRVWLKVTFYKWKANGMLFGALLHRTKCAICYGDCAEVVCPQGFAYYSVM